MWDNPAAVTAAATAVFAGLWIFSARPDRLSATIFGGVLVLLVFVSLFFHPHFQNIVIGKDIAAQVGGYTLFLLWLSHIFRKNAFTLTASPMNIAVLVFFLAGVLSAFLAPRWTWYYSLEEISRNAAVILMFFMVVKFFNTRSRWTAGLWTLMACMGLTSLYGMAQVAGYDFVNWGFKTNVSTFGNKDFFASYLTYTMPVAVSLAIASTHAVDAGLWIALAGLALFNIVQGETRGAWLGLIALAGITVWFEMTLGRFRNVLGTLKRKAIFACIVVMAILLVIQAVPEHKIRTFQSIFQTHSGTNIIRVYIWWTSMRMWWDEPLFGQGLGTYQLTYPFFRLDRYNRIGMSHNTRHAHSEELELLSEQGMLGFSAWAAMICVFFFLGVRKLKETTDARDRYLLYGVLSGLAAGLVHDSINVNLRWMSSAFAFFFVLGLGTRVLIGFDPAPDKKKGAAALLRRDWRREAPLGVVLATAFAFMFWMQYIVLRADHLLRVVEGTVEVPAMRKMGIDHGRQVLRLVPYDHSAYYKMAYAFLNLEQIDEARQMYRSLFSLAPNYAQMHQNTALIDYREYTMRRERKYLYQALLEFEWATGLENSFVNHAKMMQLYTQTMNDTARSRYHNRFIFWQVLEDSLFSNYRMWNVFYLYTDRSARQFRSMYDYYLKEADEISRQYWLYRTETGQKLGRPREELRYAVKMAVRYVPAHETLTQFAVSTLLTMPDPEADLVYLINLIEHLDPGRTPPDLLRQIRDALQEHLAQQPPAGGSRVPALMAYAAGLLSHRLGEREAAASYFRQAAGIGEEIRLIRAGLKKYGV